MVRLVGWSVSSWGLPVSPPVCVSGGGLQTSTDTFSFVMSTGDSDSQVLMLVQPTNPIFNPIFSKFLNETQVSISQQQFLKNHMLTQCNAKGDLIFTRRSMTVGNSN